MGCQTSLEREGEDEQQTSLVPGPGGSQQQNERGRAALYPRRGHGSQTRHVAGLRAWPRSDAKAVALCSSPRCHPASRGWGRRSGESQPGESQPRTAMPRGTAHLSFPTVSLFS